MTKNNGFVSQIYKLKMASPECSEKQETKRGKYVKWGPDDLKAALEAVKDGKGVNAAAKVHKIPSSTLKTYLKKKAGEKVAQGRPKIFLPDMEKELVKHILLFEERMFGLTIKDIKKLAHDVAEKLGIAHNFKNGCAGNKWYYNFMKRNPTLSLRQPESTSLARMRGFSRERVNKFFDLLEDTADKLKIDGTRIFNVDESGFNPVQKKPQKVVGLKGKHQVGAAASGERGVNTTVVCCVSASGFYVPPMFIFKRKRHDESLAVGAPTGSVVTISDTGYITSDLFLTWLKHFQKSVMATKENPVLLLLDGHSTHSKNLEALLYAREHGIALLQLPSHATHRMQPLDVGFFRPLNVYYIQAIEKFLRQHHGTAVKPCNLVALLSEAYGRAATMVTAENAFRASGIWPVDRHIFKDCDFAASDALEYPDSGINSPSSTSIPSRMDPVSSSPLVPPTSFAAALKEISPLPAAGSNTVTKRKQQDAVLLTSTPYKDELEGKKEKMSKKAPQKKRPRRRLFPSESSDEDFDLPVQAKKRQCEAKQRKRQHRDFVLVQFVCEMDKRVKHYVGEIIGDAEERGIKVKFMRKKLEKMVYFTFLDEEDFVEYKQIVATIGNWTCTTRGLFQFPNLPDMLDSGMTTVY